MFDADGVEMNVNGCSSIRRTFESGVHVATSIYNVIYHDVSTERVSVIG
tara:strand:+ start:660 stop:806 length:147 start_codon:yes stop_codon:yes gene_type:complete